MRKLPRGTLDKWVEFDSIEPIGEQRLQTAEITALLYRLTSHTLAHNGVPMKPIKIDGYMPPRYRPEEPDKPLKRSKPEDDFKQMASVFRLGKVVEKYGRNNQSS